MLSAMVSCQQEHRSLTTVENGTVAYCSVSVSNVILSSCYRVPSQIIRVLSSFNFIKSWIIVIHVVNRSIASDQLNGFIILYQTNYIPTCIESRRGRLAATSLKTIVELAGKNPIISSTNHKTYCIIFMSYLYVYAI